MVEGVCGRVRRLMRRRREERMQAQIDFVAHLGGTIVSTTPAISKSGDEAQNSWKFGFSMVKRIGAVIDSGLPLEDLKDFVSALQASGAKYEDANVLVEQVEEYAAENGPNYNKTSLTGLFSPRSPIASQGVISVGSGTLPARSKADVILEQADLTLVNLAFAGVGTKFCSILQTVTRLEPAAGIICWVMTDSVKDLRSGSSSGGTEAAPVDLDDMVRIALLEIPRLKLSFHEQKDENGVWRLYSLDHANLFVSNYRSALTARLLAGMPHSLLLSTTNEELQVLVPAIDPVRPRIGSSPFSTGTNPILRSSDYNSQLTLTNDQKYSKYTCLPWQRCIHIRCISCMDRICKYR